MGGAESPTESQEAMKNTTYTTSCAATIRATNEVNAECAIAIEHLADGSDLFLCKLGGSFSVSTERKNADGSVTYRLFGSVRGKAAGVRLACAVRDFVNVAAVASV